MEHCLREWASGVQVQCDLEEEIDAISYRIHLDNHTEWKHINEKMTTLVLKHIAGRLL